MRLLNDLIIKALGVDESRVTGFESMDVEFGISLPLFAIIAALAVAGIMALLYVKTQEPLRLWKRLLLCLLRLVGMLIVVALVLGTTIVMNINRGKAPETTFLLDRTPSMSYTDGDKGASRQELMDSALNADSATFASLTDRSPVQKKLVGLAETPMSTDGTLPHTLSQALLAEQSADVAGDATSADIGDVVIFSDFHERDPEALIEAARLIREEGRRVHTVGVGTETPVDAEV
ncbi:MAG: hypothetical protein QF662_03950, partial [Phycisphaerae bacterium]|nr:hypothetical protein [Phycisphaerae bacterium]